MGLERGRELVRKSTNRSGSTLRLTHQEAHIATAELVECKSLERGSLIDVETKSRHYQIECLGGDRIRISGHPEFAQSLLRLICRARSTAKVILHLAWSGVACG